ncbi:hypothetical protein [Sorangium sp. So ce1153]|uniref:hypothetical protein n=1 Tax=Sorangium sp. So ce1153 TaxID=3133333 RepID=UPI003F61C427
MPAARALALRASTSREAGAAGFADAAHMTRTFRRMFGVSPSDRRRRGPLSKTGAGRTRSGMWPWSGEPRAGTTLDVATCDPLPEAVTRRRSGFLSQVPARR